MGGFSIKRTGSWEAARRKYEAAAKDPKKRVLLALRRAALILEREIKQGLKSGTPGGGAPLRPLAPMTILLRRNHSSRPLLDTGGLLGAVSSKVDEASGTAFVGILRTGLGGDQDQLVRLAEIHEFGTGPYAIPVTDRMRAFFLALSLHSGGAVSPLRSGTSVIYHPGIPARPFVRPALESARAKIGAEIKLVLEG